MSSSIPEALRPVVTFFHPVLMTLTLAFTIYVGYLGWQIRRTRTADPELRKELVKAKFNVRHFQVGSILLVLLVLGAVGGMAVTYINNGKLFVSPPAGRLGLGLFGDSVSGTGSFYATGQRVGTGYPCLSQYSVGGYFCMAVGNGL